MKRILILIQLVLFISCNKSKLDIDMYKTQGIPNVNQSFAYMYFKNEKDGYLFGTYTIYDPEIIDEANIYKTVDGGHNWKKIDSIPNSNYSSIAVYDLSKYIFISMRNSLIDFNSKIMRFDIEGDKLYHSNDIKTISALWSSSSVLNYTSNRGDKKLYSLNSNLELIDSIKIKDYAIDGTYIESDNYAVFAGKGIYYFAHVTKDKVEKISLPVIPDNISRIDKDRLIISGRLVSNKSHVGLVSYNINTGKEELIQEFESYSIIQGLKSNEKVIAGFIGNIKGVFTEYDLVYSLDKGKTWEIQKLKERSYIRPSCLVGNVMYIYSGGARMQKIEFK